MHLNFKESNVSTFWDEIIIFFARALNKKLFLNCGNFRQSQVCYLLTSIDNYFNYTDCRNLSRLINNIYR